MKLEGILHVTAITADAPGNVDVYTRVLGLRLVKKSPVPSATWFAKRRRKSRYAHSPSLDGAVPPPDSTKSPTS